MFPQDRAILPFAISFFIIGLLFLAINSDGTFIDWSDDGTFVAQDNDVDFVDGDIVGASVTYDGNNITVTLDHIDIDTAADEECATWEATGSAIEWQACGGGGGGGGVAMQEDGVALAGTSTIDFDQGILGFDVGGGVVRTRLVLTEATLTTDNLIIGIGSIATATPVADFLLELELDTEAELEAQLTNVSDVFTNNDSSIVTGNITDDSLLEADLDLVNAPTDEHCLTFETGAGGDFEWQVCAAGGGGGATNTLDEDDVELMSVLVTINCGQGLDCFDNGSNQGELRVDVAEATLAEDNVWVGTGGIANATSLPDSDGVGQVLQYDVTGNDFLAHLLVAADIPAVFVDSAAIDTEAALEAFLTDVTNVLTDGDVWDDLSDVVVAGASDAAMAIFDTGSGTWRDFVISGDGTISDTGVLEVTEADAFETDPTDCGAGEFADAIAANGNLTCNSVDISADTNLAAGRSLTLSGDSVEADNELFEHACTWSYIDLATDTADAGLNANAGCFPDVGLALTVERFDCVTSVGSASVSIDEVTRVNVYGSGSTIDTAQDAYQCTTSGIAGGSPDTSFTNASIAAGSGLRVDIGTTTSDAGIDITIIVDFDKDD